MLFIVIHKYLCFHTHKPSTLNFVKCADDAKKTRVERVGKRETGPERFVFAYVLSFFLAGHLDVKTLPCE